MMEELLETNPDGLVRRHESSVVEFKANFNFGSIDKYAKTMAAFANNRGGTIVFGVSNSPRKPVGMTNDQFAKLDPQELAGKVNSLFAPEIRWSLEDYENDTGDKFGFIVVENASFKPVIALKSSSSIITEGSIYYRYNGRNGAIKYAELSKIIDEIRRSEQDLWMEHLQRIARIGPSQAAVFNPSDGLVEGARGSFLIDKSLLPGLSFIREGELKPSGGAPIYTLQGKAEIVSGESSEGLIGIAERAISENDVMVNFLNSVEVPSPVEYLKSIFCANSKYLPFYYYADLAGIPRKDISGFITSVHGFSKFKDRIRDDRLRLPTKLKKTGSVAARKKAVIVKDLRKGSIQIAAERMWLRYFFESLRSIQNVKLIRSSLLECYKLPLRDLEIIGDFRYAVCYLDWLLYGKG